MNNLNVQFFEQYKIVEKICSEMYGIHNGLSQYINELSLCFNIYCFNMPFE